MNKKGHPATLVAAHPGNGNAMRHGVFSQGVIAARAAEILEQLTAGGEPEPEEAPALLEVARTMAVLERLDWALDAQDVVDRHGKVRYLVEIRTRTSRQLERWLRVLQEARRARPASAILKGERSDYVARLQTIALRPEPGTSVADQLRALQLLLSLGPPGTTSGSLLDETHRAATSRQGDRIGKSYRREGREWKEDEG